ncbi:MAG: M4 family metallopeptidase [Chitinophagales bacterium]|nr:M4 family metallopeptidase [Chitinophagales bacterium]
MKRLLLILSLWCMTASLLAQNSYWQNFDTKQQSLSATRLAAQKNTLGLGFNDELISLNIQQDELGYKHYRYQQNFRDYPVEGAQLLIHENEEGKVYAANGGLVLGIEGEANVVLNEAAALQKALQYSKGKTFAWQNDDYQKALQASTDNPHASFYPKGELVWASNSPKKEPQSYKLSYKFDVYTIEPLSRKFIFVDAKTGEVVTTINRLHDADAPCTGTARYSCSNPVAITADNQGTYYRLRESVSRKIETYTANNGTTYSFWDITSTDNNFNEDITATAVHWSTEKTYDYFKNTHNRNSFDGNNAKLMSWVHFGNGFDNAFWNGNFMTYGDGSIFSPLVSTDIVGHEIMHGITQYTANLTYSYEPGALNESFSDIFGTVIEFYADPTCADWMIGEDITSSYNGGQGIRNMQNPNLHEQPDTYEGTYWYTGSGDNGGVHYNSGVQNYWFYLLCQGGSGTNDFGTTYNVTAIGMTKAARIAYRMLSAFYLSPSSQYSDARVAAISAATDLYGANSAEVTQVVNAWCAVGVGTCSLSQGTITVTSPNGGEIWQAGSTQNITWTSTGTVSNVNLYYSIDGGSNWNFIANQANTGSYTWTVPNSPTTLARVRVENSSNSTVADNSNANFTIQGCNVIASFSSDSGTTVCVPSTINFTNTSTGATAYNWSLNGTAQSTATNFSYLFNNAGIYTIQLTASNGNCSDTYTQTITVQAAANAAFTHTESDLTLSTFATQLSANSYTWDFGDGTTATTQNATHTYTAAGTYNVCLTVVNNCGSNNVCESVSVNLPTNSCNYYSKIYGNTGLTTTVGSFFYNEAENTFYIEAVKKINASTGELIISNNSTINVGLPTQSNSNTLVGVRQVASNNTFTVSKVQNDLSSHLWSKDITVTNTNRYVVPRLTKLSDNSIALSSWRKVPNTGSIDDLGMMRIDTTGSILWANYYNYGSDDQFGKVINDGADNLISVGIVGGGGGNIVIAKINPDGTHVNSYSYSRGNSNSMATPDNIIKTIDGGYAICAQYVYNLSLPDPHKIVLIKLDGNFAIQWVRNISYNSQTLNIGSYSIAQNADGNYFVASNFVNGSANNTLITKLGSNGDYIWAKILSDNSGTLNTPYTPLLYSIGNDIILFAATQNTSNVFGTNDMILDRTDSDFSTLCTIDATVAVGNETWTSSSITPTTGISTYTIADLTPTITSNPLLSQPFCGSNTTITAQFTSPPTPTCANTPITFTNTSTGATAYQWKVNGTNVGTAANLNYTFSTAGTYTIMLEATNGTCSDTYSQDIIINDSATQLELGSDILQCGSSGSFTLDCGISGGLWYNWDLNGTLVGTTQSITAAQTGMYRLSVMDACNQVGIDSVYVLLDDNCVWPGDVNHDNIVNYLDLLPIGLNYGATGNTRPNASFAFNAQPCTDWSATQSNGQNLKHADCNGNGIIDNNDPAAIQLNYSQTHGIAPANPVNSSSPISLSAALGTAPPSFGNSTIIRIDLYANNTQNVNVTAYGLGFDVNYQFPNCIKVNNAYIDFSGSWLGTVGVDMATAQKNFLNSNLKSGHVEVAMTRLNHQNVSGYGKIGSLVADVDIYASAGGLQAAASLLGQQMTVANGTFVPIGATSGSFNLSNPAAPVVSVAANPTTALIGGSCGSTLTATVSNCNGCTYQWKRNNTTISGASSASYSPTQTGTYYVIVTASSGLSASASVAVAYNNAIVNTSGTALPFCTPSGINASAEYIKSVQFGTDAANVTASDSGYGNYTCSKVFNLNVDCPATLTLQPKFVGATQTEYWTVWVDKNMDGDFVDAGEQIWQKITTNGTAFSKTFAAANIPSSLLGKTFRMRVAMKRGSYATSPCENFAQGEVEDYTLRFIASNCRTDETLEADTPFEAVNDFPVQLFPNPVTDVLQVYFTTTNSSKTDIRVYDVVGRLVFEEFLWSVVGENNTQINTQQLPNGIYFLQITHGNEQKTQRFVKQ